MTAQQGRTTQTLLTLAAVVVVIAGLKASQELMVPFLLALFLSILGASPMLWLQQRGLPLLLALSTVIAGFLLLGVLLAGLVGSAVTDFTQNIPLYQEKLRGQMQAVIGWLQAQGVSTGSTELAGIFNPGAAMTFVGKLLNGLGGVLANSFLILITIIFMLLEAAGFQGKIAYIAGHCEVKLGNMDKFTADVRRYIAIKTWISLVTGILVTLALLVIGVDYALLWGVVAFALNYVPNIGSIIAGVPAVMLALIQLGPAHALAATTAYIVINLVMGNAVEPKFMGRGLGLSPLIVFLSLLFWGWVLGPVGMLLSVPLTISAKLALDAREETRWLGILLGPDVHEPQKTAAEGTSAEE